MQLTLNDLSFLSSGDREYIHALITESDERKGAYDGRRRTMGAEGQNGWLNLNESGFLSIWSIGTYHFC